MSQPKCPVFPSDLGSRGDGDWLLAGRVVHREPGAIWIADAFAVARVDGSADLDVGDLAVLSVHRKNQTTALGAVIEKYRSVARPGREQARLLHTKAGVNLLARSRALGVARSFFAARGFIEVDTPLLVRSPGLDVHLSAVSSSSGFLITSPEYQMKRLLAGGIPRLFQLSHVFRRGESGPLHNPEFALLEWYRAFAGVEEVMGDTEELITQFARSIVGRPELPTDRGPIALDVPFSRLTVAQAFERYAGTSAEQSFALSRDDPESYFRLMVDRVEPGLHAENRPVFLVEYPITQASLARPKPGDPRVCERFELYAGGVELCNGFGELTDPVEQRRRLLADQEARAKLGRDVYPIDERFLQALEEGMPPSAGNALGFDRLLALCLGERDIAEVIPLPEGVL